MHFWITFVFPKPRRLFFEILSILLLLGLVASVQAQFKYYTNNGAITITGYTGPGGNVIIPSLTNGLPIARIDNSAFRLCTNMTSVVIGDRVTDIGAVAFSQCTALTNVTMGTNLAKIRSLAFWGCSSLKNVTIPGSVTNIGLEAFVACSNLTAITVDTNNSFYSDLNGVLFNKSGDTIVQYPAGLGGSCTIPDGIVRIEPSAFATCNRLTNVTISASVRSIGNAAFKSCDTLTAIMVDTNNTEFREMEGVLFDKGASTLIQCPAGLSGSYVIPDSVTTVGLGAFYSCTRLTSVTIPASVTSLGDETFYSCTSLTNVTIPGNVTSIGNDLFSQCTNLIHVMIPGSVVSIGERAFYCCRGITNVTIPSNVTNIGDWSFYGCTSLREVHFEGDAPGLGSGAFSRDNDATVYFLPGTADWGTTFGGRPTAPWFTPYPLILGKSVGLQTNGFGFTISWATNASVIIEATTNTANALWLPVCTNALADGSVCFSDSQWMSYAGRFYRVRLQ